MNTIPFIGCINLKHREDRLRHIFVINIFLQL